MLLFIILLGYSSAVLGLCPPSENIAPFCNCKDIAGDSFLTCSNIMTPDELMRIFRSPVMSNYKMYSVDIVNSSLLYIPQDLFKGTTFEKIMFIDSEVMSMSDSDLAFVGLEDTLLELRASGAQFIAQWDWQQLRNMKRLSLLDVHSISMGSVPEPFPAIPNLNALGILRAEISTIADQAFEKLTKLAILNMKQNSITDLKRGMFPNPAENLAILDFSENKLSALPNDFFYNMPNLKNVHLGKNKFFTLPEKVFAAPMETLQELTFEGNKFECDCRMRWLVGRRVPFIFNAVCSHPKSLAGVKVKFLSPKLPYC